MARTDELQLMGRTEVADALGIAPQNLGKVVGLPAPIQRLARGDIWDAQDIRVFGREYRRRRHRQGRAA